MVGPPDSTPLARQPSKASRELGVRPTRGDRLFSTVIDVIHVSGLQTAEWLNPPSNRPKTMFCSRGHHKNAAIQGGWRQHHAAFSRNRERTDAEASWEYLPPQRCLVAERVRLRTQVTCRYASSVASSARPLGLIDARPLHSIHHGEKCSEDPAFNYSSRCSTRPSCEWNRAIPTELLT